MPPVRIRRRRRLRRSPAVGPGQPRVRLERTCALRPSSSTEVTDFELTRNAQYHRRVEPFAPLLYGEDVRASDVLHLVSRDAVEAFGDDGIASNPEAGDLAPAACSMPMLRTDVVRPSSNDNPNYFREGLLGLWTRARANMHLIPNRIAHHGDRWGAQPLPRHPRPASRQPRGQQGRDHPDPAGGDRGLLVRALGRYEPLHRRPRVRLALHLATNREQTLRDLAQGFVEIGEADRPDALRRIRAGAVDRAPPTARLPDDRVAPSARRIWPRAVRLLDA